MAAVSPMMPDRTAELRKQIAQIERALESHTRRLEADRAALAANQRERKNIEGNNQLLQQKISKLRDQMSGAKTNEQYKPGSRRPYGLLEWPAMRRLADRIDPSYKQ